MIEWLTSVGGAAALVATLSACTAAAPSPLAPAAGDERELTSAVAAPTTAAVGDATTATAGAPTTVASAPVATVVIAVPPMPAHLTPIRPSDPTVDGHGQDDGAGPVDDGEVAVAWIAAVYTARFDHPGTNADAATALSDDPELAATAIAALPALDVDRLEVRWPVVTDVVDASDDWWQVTFVLKRTTTGQVGPTTSGPHTARVHVVAGQVAGWEPPR